MVLKIWREGMHKDLVRLCMNNLMSATNLESPQERKVKALQKLILKF